VFVPGTKWDHVLILEGDQGIGKSSVVRILGTPWESDFPIDPHSRDTVQAMLGKWVIELSELDVLKRHEMSALKGFITKQSDRARFPYARAQVDYPRQCIFIGTINPEIDGYLQDTQNRRFWPVLCEHIDLPGLEHDRDQLWAEAYQAYLIGETLWLSDDSVAKLAEEEQEQRTVSDVWEERVFSWAMTAKQTYYTVAEIFNQALVGDVRTMTRSDQIRLGRIMARFGWKKQSIRVDGLTHPVKRLLNPMFFQNQPDQGEPSWNLDNTNAQE